MLGHQGQGSVGCWGCRARAGLKVVGDEERTVEVEVVGRESCSGIYDDCKLEIAWVLGNSRGQVNSMGRERSGNGDSTTGVRNLDKGTRVLENSRVQAGVSAR